MRDATQPEPMHKALAHSTHSPNAFTVTWRQANKSGVPNHCKPPTLNKTRDATRTHRHAMTTSVYAPASPLPACIFDKHAKLSRLLSQAICLQGRQFREGSGRSCEPALFFKLAPASPLPVCVSEMCAKLSTWIYFTSPDGLAPNQ